MEWLTDFISTSNTVLWSYVLIVLLLACAAWFSYKTGFVQFRQLGEMVRLLGESTTPKQGENKRHISSFQAFAVSLASRVGTGNLAGVATAIAVGGAGAVFWMWVISLFGAATAFIESTLAQLYKQKGKDSYVGGPAYYMTQGLGMRWLGVLFAVLITITFGFAFNTVQSNTICAAFESAFGWNHTYVGIVLTLLTLSVIFGGIQRIARVSGIIVPLMAVGYIILAFTVVILNIGELPRVLAHIVGDAFGWHQVAGGGIGAALMQGIKRGLFSNEAGMGSAPNAAATASTSHPVKQGLIQALGVFTDTLIICSCTAFIILFSGAPLDGSIGGVQLTQAALTREIGSIGGIYIAISLFFFAFSSIIGNYYYGESNIRFITNKRWVLTLFRILVGGMVMCGALMSLQLAWDFADFTMALMTLCNLFAILLLGKQAIRLLHHYTHLRKQGVKNPTYRKGDVEGIPNDKINCWED